jgi:outer membrane protein OmpA-like peptidoglycan-associated protein/opacity protein-like surface antigen
MLGALLALLIATPVAAQDRGTFEAGLFGRYTLLDRDLRLDDSAGLGGRLGYFFYDRLALEVDGGLTRVDGSGTQSVDVLPLHARFLYDLPAWDQISLLLGAGYAHYRYGNDLAPSVSEGGVGGLVGLRFRDCGPLSFRIEGTLDQFSSSDLIEADDQSATNWGLQFGASLFFGHKGRCDADNDGVADQLDRCPNTPVGDAVDGNGCSLPNDSDGDGVIDPRDNCPGTPRGERVDANGCPLPKDSDGDGVMDPQDKCPGTPRGERVDSAGCPLPKDSDGDGVLDPQDRCANTPRGTRVDASGCPVVFEEGKRELVLEGVYFETAKATLLPESQAVLDRMAVSLAAYPDLKVEVAGYTDSHGGRAVNVRLSQARARAVADYLVGKGIAAGNLTAKGYGPDKPIGDNATDKGRARNRRVELLKMD